MGDRAIVVESPARPVTGLSPGAAGHVSTGACLNCGASLTGAFCAACGQRDVPPYPSVRDLVVDAFWELSGSDGRFANTVRALVQRPGMLTREFLEGRRARYLSPLRLYLMASLAYFVLAAALPPREIDDVVVPGSNAVAGAPALSRPDRVAQELKRAVTAREPVGVAERKAALADVEHAPSLMRPFLRRAIGNPAGFRRDLLEAVPRMLFVLLPIFAGIISLFYRRRNYPEHLYFAIHLHSFVFLALGASALVKFTHVLPLVRVASAVALFWIPVYATLAFRRVYGGSVVRTLVKEAAIGAIYGVTSFAAFIATLYWVSIR